MAWLRIDDRVRTHPKVAQAGPSAAWLWFCGICYCREHLTDGFIPKAAVTSLAMNLPSPWKHANRLVEVRLWEDAVGGYTVHDFLDWNPSRADVISSRAAETERKRTERGQTPVSARTKPSVRGVSSRERAGDAGSGSVSGSGSGDSGLSEKSARETQIAPYVNPHSKPTNLINGSEQRRHGMHAWCCDRGLCVPWGLHADFTARLGGEHADSRLKLWYAETMAGIEGTPVGDDLFDFWRNHFTAWVGTVTTKATGTESSAAHTLRAARSLL